jgi:hypothetical protein
MGILWYLFAAYRVFAGLIGIFVLRGFTGSGWPFRNHFGGGFGGWGPQHGFWGALLPVIALGTVITAGLAAFAGWGLLNRRAWGRTVAIVAAVLALFKFPLGTALGIYTLWVLAPGESGMEWDGIAERE